MVIDYEVSCQVFPCVELDEGGSDVGMTKFVGLSKTTEYLITSQSSIG